MITEYEYNKLHEVIDILLELIKANETHELKGILLAVGDKILEYDEHTI